LLKADLREALPVIGATMYA